MNSIQKIVSEYHPEPGFFLEIGCWDGENISNTAELERNGWSGICVDPFPRNFNNRKALLVSKAVDSVTGSREFVKVSIDRTHGGDVSYFSGFKDTITNNPNIWELIQDKCDYEIINVETIGIMELLNSFDTMCGYGIPRKIDFLSIDTEGSELSILKAIDFNKFTFGIIVVEHNYNKNTQKELKKLMLNVGYEIIGETDIDYIFKKK